MHIGRLSGAMKAKESVKPKQPSPRVVQLPTAVTLAVGKNLHKYRIAARKSQEDLAHEAEVERSRISKLENGRINPSLLTLATLSHCLGVTLEQLFVGVTATLPPASETGEVRRANQAYPDKPAPVKKPKVSLAK